MKDIIRGNREVAVLLEEENYKGYNYYITFTHNASFCIYIQVPVNKVEEYSEVISDVFYPDDAFDCLKWAGLYKVTGMKYLGYDFAKPDYLPNNELMKEYIEMTDANKAEYCFNKHILEEYKASNENNMLMYGSKGDMTQDKCRDICKEAIDRLANIE